MSIVHETIIAQSVVAGITLVALIVLNFVSMTFDYEFIGAT